MPDNAGRKLLALGRLRMELDRAVFFATLSVIWRLLSGPFTVILIALCFSREVQGFYYTFASMMALQVFAELGLGQVIIQFASHEWANLRLEQGRLAGDSDALSRLVSLGRFAIGWYACGAAAMALLLGAGGYYFISHSTNSAVNWAMPWFGGCLLSAAMFGFVPLWSLLEGCN